MTKSRDISTRQRSLTFEVDYPEAAEGSQPRHRLMSAFEQRVDVPPDRAYQYLLLACEPYETIAFKIPNQVLHHHHHRSDENNQRIDLFDITILFDY